MVHILFFKVIFKNIFFLRILDDSYVCVYAYISFYVLLSFQDHKNVKNVKHFFQYFFTFKKQILFLAQKFKKYIFRIISENLKSLAQKMAELLE